MKQDKHGHSVKTLNSVMNYDINFFRVPVVDLRGEDFNDNSDEVNSDNILDFSSNTFENSDYGYYDDYYSYYSDSRSSKRKKRCEFDKNN